MQLLTPDMPSSLSDPLPPQSLLSPCHSHQGSSLLFRNDPILLSLFHFLCSWRNHLVTEVIMGSGYYAWTRTRATQVRVVLAGGGESWSRGHTVHNWVGGSELRRGHSPWFKLHIKGRTRRSASWCAGITPWDLETMMTQWDGDARTALVGRWGGQKAQEMGVIDWIYRVRPESTVRLCSLGGCMGHAPPLSSREHTAEGAQEIWKAQCPLWERMDSRWCPGTGHDRFQTRSWVSALHHQREETVLAVRGQEAWDSQCARTRRPRSSGWPRGQQGWAGGWRGCIWTCIAGEGLKSWWREDCG